MARYPRRFGSPAARAQSRAAFTAMGGFLSVIDAALSSVIESNTVTLSGLVGSPALTISGGQYSKNGAAYSSAATTVTNGDTLKLRVTSSATAGATASVVATIDGTARTFSVSTAASTPVPTMAFVVTVIAVTEGNSGTKTVSNQINVTRNGVTGPLTINLGYSGTADSSDFSGPVSGTIAANASSLTFDITVNGDTAVEQDETVVIDAALLGYSATARKTITITNDDVSGTPEMIGGLAVGTVLTSGPFAGMMVTDGDDFNGAISLVGPAPRNRYGDYVTTRGPYIPKGTAQAPRSSENLGGTDADPYWTGHNNSNRGAPIASMADTITQRDGKLILKQRPMLESEKAHVLRNNRSLLSAMITTALRNMVRAPAVFEWEEKRNTIAEDHFTGWSMDRFSFSVNEVEPDAEAGSHLSGTGDGRDIEFNINTWADGIRQPERSSGGEVIKVDHSTTHRFAFFYTEAGAIEFYLDGVLKRTFSNEPELVLRFVKQLLFTAHAYNVDRPEVESTYEILWWRSLAKNGHFKPLLPPILIQAAAGVPFNVALPSSTDLWGRAVNEDMQSLMCEPNEPGGTVNGVQYGDAPPGFTLNKTAPSVSGSSMTPGRLQFGRVADEPGYSARPHRFVVEIGPVINISELNFTQGVDVDIDIYKMIDFGILVTDGDKPSTTITIDPLYEGLAFSNTTGRLTGKTNAAVGSQNVTITAINSVQQQASVTVPAKVGAKPVDEVYAYQSYPSLVGDFDASRDAAFSVQTGDITTWANAVANAGDLSQAPTVTPKAKRLSSQLGGRSVVRFVRGADGANSTVLESPKNVPLTSVLQGTDSSWTLVTLFRPLAALTGSVAGWSEQIDSGSARNVGTVRRTPGTGSTPTQSSLRMGNTTQTSSNIDIGAIPDNAYTLGVARHTGGKSDYWKNKVKTADGVAHTSTTVWTAAARFSIGNLQGGTGQASRYPTTAFDGDVAQVIAFNAALTDAQITQLMDDIYKKWGLG